MTEPIAIAAVEAEQALLGGLLLNNNLMEAVGDKLRPEHFSDDWTRMIFTELTRQINASQPADMVTVCEALGDKVVMSDVVQLIQYEPTFRTMPRYAELIVDRFLSRQLLTAANDITDLAYNVERPVAERLVEAQANLASLHVDADEDEWSEIYEGLIAHSEVLERRVEGGSVAGQLAYRIWATCTASPSAKPA